MERQEVQSSNIKSIGHDLKSMTLEVEFSTGKVYTYKPVTEHAYLELISADSIGSYFYKNIRNNKAIKCSKNE